MERERLFRVVGTNFVAGFVVNGKVMIRHAPILGRWLRGKSAGAGYRALLAAGFDVGEVLCLEFR